jgi:neutral ceramidase
MKKVLNYSILFLLLLVFTGQTSIQTGQERLNLLVYKDAGGKTKKVKSADQWEKCRSQILDNMQKVMGPVPDASKKVPPDMKIIDETRIDNLKRLKITFAVESGDRVPAYLFIPDGISGKVPGILCLHQTIKSGKEEPAGIAGSPNLHYAMELARRGYVTIAPDYPNFGEYSFDPYQNGYVSATMKGIWNHMAAIDLLQSLPEVNPDLIGCIGHSLGGHNTLFIAAFDKRIKAAVTSCGFNSFFKYYGGDLTGWSHKGYMPRIASSYEKNPSKMPFDFPGVLAAIAPRALFINAPLKDSNFEISGVYDCVNAARPVYDLLKAHDKIVMTNPDAPHDFPPAAREEAYAFLDRELKMNNTGKETGLTSSKKKGDVKKVTWQVGLGRRAITPHNDVWLAGYGQKRAAENKIHDIWVKVLALKTPGGRRVVMATTDHMGMSRSVYESIYSKVNQRFGIGRPDFMITFSHNHCGPCLRDDLVDYYPSDEAQRKAVGEYTDWMETQVIDAVADALSKWQPADLFMGEGKCTFAVNRRENPEAEVPKMIEAGIPFKGVVDHYVPVLAIKSKKGKLLGVLFGYACHPTTLSFNSWCGDYPGFAQINLESNHPGLDAMFFNACGADQNPLPRRKLEYCQNYGKMLSDAVEKVLANPMKQVSPGIGTAFKFVDLAYEEMITREKLLPIASRGPSVQERWAKRMLGLMDQGTVFPTAYPYPVQAWQLGNELLLISIGGESVVDYSLRFKREYGPGTWVCGYANDMAAYVPSRRVWEEGGYEGGPHLDEYGRPAWRWAGDIEDRISSTVHQVVEKAKTEK